MILLVDFFVVCDSGIFNTAILHLFRMVVGVVLGRMFCSVFVVLLSKPF